MSGVVSFKTRQVRLGSLLLIMIPNYLLLSQLGWLNFMSAMVVPQLASAFAINVLLRHMRAFPTELDDAACIDGVGNRSLL